MDAQFRVQEEELDERKLRWSRACWGEAAPSVPILDSTLAALILEHVSTRVVVVDRDRRYRYANAEALKFMGLPAECVVGRLMSEVLDERVYHGFVPIFERAFGGESVHLEGWVRYKKHGRRFREQQVMPYAPGGGTVQAVVVCGLDHTALRLSEQQLAIRDEQLRLSEALKTAIVDNAHAAIVSTRSDGSIVEFNPSAEAMFGWSRTEVIGRSASDLLIPRRYRDRHEVLRHRLCAGELPRLLGRRRETQALCADGREIPVEVVVWRTDVDARPYYTASINDLSERQRATLEIQRQREALRRCERFSTMGGLVAGVAHELNNPLAIVMGRAALLEERCASRPDLQREARQIRDAAERCGRIVRSFLDMARGRPLQRCRVALNDTVRAAAELLAFTYRTHDTELRLDLGDALPPLLADEDQLAQIVLNLLVNAQQVLATVEVAERRVVVTTEAERDAAGNACAVRLRVADTRPGVSEDAKARLFEVCFTAKAEGIGTGLGLASSRAVARDHGGDLVLEASDSGAAFVLTLPIG
ncbi:two-component system sensor histidine kinase NtrB [Aquabacterium humicola]|uniref:two-component system sensor histidine kinase NtrB n=1 Tax=Aquabacterium humicola TaxID=3237377 RepID=UPI00254292E7|nr:PAS domain S-box protein [Rubrivivax pictus]